MIRTNHCIDKKRRTEKKMEWKTDAYAKKIRRLDELKTSRKIIHLMEKVHVEVSE